VRTGLGGRHYQGRRHVSNSKQFVLIRVSDAPPAEVTRLEVQPHAPTWCLNGKHLEDHSQSPTACGQGDIERYFPRWR